MTCLLNTYGLISSVKQLIQYLNDKEQGIVAASLPLESTESKNQKIGKKDTKIYKMTNFYSIS